MARQWRPPAFPRGVVTSYYDGPWGLMRSRAVGRPRADVVEVVVVQGMGVADYLMPAVGALGGWTRAHLVELPGFAGSGDPPRELTVTEYGRCVADWLDAHEPESGGRVVLVGHSSGTQVAASAGVSCPMVGGVVLAAPTVDPAARGPLRLLVRWRWDGHREPPGWWKWHRPEWRRAGTRRLLHLVRVHLADHLEDSVAKLTVPLLVIRGRDDVIGTRTWSWRLAAMSPRGDYVEVPGAHSFPWRDPTAWSAPIHAFATRLPVPHRRT